MLFYFDLYDNMWSYRDEYGEDLPTKDEAEDMAAALVIDLVREAMPTYRKRTIRCEVRIGDGSVVHRSEMVFSLTRSDTQDPTHPASRRMDEPSFENVKP